MHCDSKRAYDNPGRAGIGGADVEKRDKQIGELALRENTMNLQQIKYIIAISEELNISKAAEKMFISQSAMSQQLMNTHIRLA